MALTLRVAPQSIVAEGLLTASGRDQHNATVDDDLAEMLNSVLAGALRLAEICSPNRWALAILLPGASRPRCRKADGT